MQTNVRTMETHVEAARQHIDGVKVEVAQHASTAGKAARNARESEQSAERYAGSAWRATSEIETSLGIGMFEYDEDGDVMPKESPSRSLLYELDEDGDIMPL